MQGDKQVIKYLNQVLTGELTTVNQYFLHARILDNWGMTRLGKYEFGESMDEMRHADWIIKRILFLEGLPNLQDLHRLRIGETVEEVLRADLAAEVDAVAVLREAIAYCETVRDYITRELLEKILESEEEHIDFLETELGVLERMGLPNYVQSQYTPPGES